MKKATALIICSIVTLTISTALLYSKTAREWKLAWSDEFKGPSVNKKFWSYDEGYGPNDDGWGTGGVQNYTSSPENSYIKNGCLIIKAIYLGGAYNERNYTSAKLTTKNKVEVQYGKVAARIKAPYGKGVWPAFWLLGTNVDEVGWPKCGEIDIMEMFGGGKGKDDTVLGTIHYFDEEAGGHALSGGQEQLEGEKLADNFHIYEIEWDPDEIIWRLDGIEYHRESINLKEHPERSGLHNKCFLILNLDIGANFERVGYPDASTKFPQTMKIDWVRVYRKQQ